MLRTWLRRYVELKEDRLLFYKPGAKASERGPLSMDLPLVTVVGVTLPETEQHIIKLMTGAQGGVPAHQRPRSPVCRASVVATAG